jgi:uncharacterized glyoxalase superfamily protein PhnB
MARTAVKPIPEGFHTVTPHLICAGAANAMEFYRQAFGAVELLRLPGPDGRLMHGCVRIGGSPIMLADECPERGFVSPKSLQGCAVVIHLCVEDVDAVVARAAQAGAKVIMPVTDMFWGDRYGQLEDPFGHRWSVATRQRDLTPAEMSAAMKECFAGK